VPFIKDAFILALISGVCIGVFIYGVYSLQIV
jgi:hypothetical protein